MAIAVMAIMGIGNAVLDAKLKADPETALPLIIGSMLPVGVVGFMLAALLSGFLATFSSTVNGGAAYLVSKAIRASRVVAFADLGMEAVYEFEVKDMPVTVAVDARGQSVHHTAPREWQARIGKIPVSAL